MFIVQPDKTIIDRIHFYNPVDIPKNLDNYLKQFYQLPDILTLRVQMDENTAFPDIFLKPYPMVSDMVMQVMITVRNSKEYKWYFLLYIDEITVPLFRDFELRIDSQKKLSVLSALILLKAF